MKKMKELEMQKINGVHGPTLPPDPWAGEDLPERSCLSEFCYRIWLWFQ